MTTLAELEVLIVDCQATAASPRGHLLEIGWARTGADAETRAHLIKLPEGERVPMAVERITGISESMTREGIEASEAWRALLDQAARLPQQPAPTIAHFARFERPFFCALAGAPRSDEPVHRHQTEPLVRTAPVVQVPPALQSPLLEQSTRVARALPLDLVCTHEIAQRLLPDLPRRGLRALTGYFGRDLGPLRRSAEHVEATAFVWRELVALLETQGITTWDALRDWLAEPHARPRPGQQRRRVWPMPRDVRLAAPDAPGLYRMQRTDGSVLYIGKASSLARRVNSYFRKQRGVNDRMLEMLSQARALTYEVTESTLEAALLEPDEIKRHRPPYNIALLDEPRHIWFTTRDLGERSGMPSSQHPIGPFTSAMILDRFAALANGSRNALGLDRDAPDARLFAAGYARLIAAHPELTRDGLNPRARLLRLGTRLWREGRRDRESAAAAAATVADEDFRLGDDDTPEDIQSDLERVALRAALARRRAKWVTRLVDASIVWHEPGADRARLIVIEHGEIVTRTWIDPGATPPVPPGHARRRDARHEGFTVARFDRLRVLMTELKRLLAEGAPVALRLDDGPPVVDARLAAALSWV